MYIVIAIWYKQLVHPDSLKHIPHTQNTINPKYISLVYVAPDEATGLTRTSAMGTKASSHALIFSLGGQCNPETEHLYSLSATTLVPISSILYFIFTRELYTISTSILYPGELDFTRKRVISAQAFYISCSILN